MTGELCPGKSAVHSGLAASTLSGRPVSGDVPSWPGPRQLNQPWAPPALAGSALAASAFASAGFLGAAGDDANEQARARAMDGARRSFMARVRRVVSRYPR